MHEDNKYGCQPHFDDTCLLHLLQRLFIKIHDPRVSSARNSRDISPWPMTRAIMALAYDNAYRRQF